MFLKIPFFYIQEFCAQQLAIYSYQNYFEILCISYIIYRALSWLEQHHNSSMTLSVYRYSLLIIVSYITKAYTLHALLMICFPIIGIFCIIIHQKTIQKQFVLSSKIFYGQNLVLKNWLETLIRSCLLSTYQKKEYLCIISRSDTLTQFIQQPYILNTPIQNNILEMLLSNTTMKDHAIILIDHLGNIMTINATWSTHMQDFMIPADHQSSHDYHNQAASLLTNKTDAIVWQINAKNHDATLWYDGAIFHHLSSDQLKTLCQKILSPGVDQALKDHQHAPSKNINFMNPKPKSKDLYV